MKQLIEPATSPSNAFLTMAYPFGSQLKCVQRYWVETAEKGAKRGQQRLVSQTTGKSWNRLYTDRIDREGQDAADAWARDEIANNRAPWNAEKPGGYCHFLVAYLDDLGDGTGRLCVKCDGVNYYNGPEAFDRIYNLVGSQLSSERQSALNALERASRKVNPECWAKWDAKTVKPPITLDCTCPAHPAVVNADCPVHATEVNATVPLPLA